MGFVDCVEEVDSHDQDVDAAAVFGVSRGAWGRARRAGADGDAVVERLRPAGDEVGQERPAKEGEEVGHFGARSRVFWRFWFVRSIGCWADCLRARVVVLLPEHCRISYHGNATKSEAVREYHALSGRHKEREKVCLNNKKSSGRGRAHL